MFSYANVTTLYVSAETGKNHYTGVHFENDKTLNGPLPSIEAALRVVGEMRRVGYMQPVTVKLMDDEFVLARPITIRTAEKGFHDPAQVRDVTFESFGEKKTLISGGKRLEGFVPDTFNGHDCWSLELEDVKEGKWKFTDLYVNGLPAARTRYPSEGYLYPEDVENKTRGTHNPSKWFIAKEGDINPNVRNIEDALINFCHYWVDEHIRIEAYDPETRKCTFAARTRMSITAELNSSATMAYYIENLGEAFHNPGEWYLDRPEGKLYYMPKEGETPENTVIYAPVLDRLVTIEGDYANGNRIEGIRFRNLAFAYTRGDFQPYSFDKDENGNLVKVPVGADGQCSSQLYGCVNFTGAHGCGVDSCDFNCCGSYGVKVYEGCDQIRIARTTVRNCAGGGVSICGGGADSPECSWTHNVYVTDCELYNLGLRYFSSSGVLVTHGYNCEISHNNIYSLYYSGVCLGWRWGYGTTNTRDNLVYKNHIWDLGKGILSDMGGVYTLGAQPGTVVDGNVIHDVKSRNYGGWALYTDEGSAYMTFRNNVCYNVSSNCYHQHYGTMNQIRNNIFAYAGNEAVRMTRREAHEGLLLENNIILCKEGKPAYGNATPMDMSSDRNLIWDESGKAPVFTVVGEDLIDHKTAISDFGWDTHSQIKNPRFKDAKNFDFTLRKDSPAFALGFKPIDTSDVGPRK